MRSRRGPWWLVAYLGCVASMSACTTGRSTTGRTRAGEPHQGRPLEPLAPGYLPSFLCWIPAQNASLLTEPRETIFESAGDRVVVTDVESLFDGGNRGEIRHPDLHVAYLDDYGVFSLREVSLREVSLRGPRRVAVDVDEAVCVGISAPPADPNASAPRQDLECPSGSYVSAACGLHVADTDGCHPPEHHLQCLRAGRRW